MSPRSNLPNISVSPASSLKNVFVAIATPPLLLDSGRVTRREGRIARIILHARSNRLFLSQRSLRSAGTKETFNKMSRFKQGKVIKVHPDLRGDYLQSTSMELSSQQQTLPDPGAVPGAHHHRPSYRQDNRHIFRSSLRTKGRDPTSARAVDGSLQSLDGAGHLHRHIHAFPAELLPLNSF